MSFKHLDILEMEKMYRDYGFCPNCGRLEKITKPDMCCSECYTFVLAPTDRYKGNNDDEFVLVSKLLKLGVLVTPYFSDLNKPTVEDYKSFGVKYSRSRKYEFIACDSDTFRKLLDASETFDIDYSKIYFAVDDDHYSLSIINMSNSECEFHEYVNSNMLRIMAALYVAMSDMNDAYTTTGHTRMYFCMTCGHIEYYDDNAYDTSCTECGNYTLVEFDEFASANNDALKVMTDYFKLGFIPLNFFQTAVPIHLAGGFTMLTTNAILTQVITKSPHHLSMFYNAVDELKFDKFKVKVQFSYGLKSVAVIPIPFNNPMPFDDRTLSNKYCNTATKYLVEFYTELLPILKKHLRAV